jgi:hypothetical protein
VYFSLEELQKDVENWLMEYNSETIETFLESKHLAKEKMPYGQFLTPVAIVR